jgi:hypothetical protein
MSKLGRKQERASRRFIERLAAGWLGCSVACAGATPSATTGGLSRLDPEVTRYRLLLGDNPVDPGQALRCYGACQERETPESYLQCLSECPGFEQTAGVACAPDEVPPRAACFTARPVPVGSEPQAGSVIIGVVANVALVVGVAAICASQTEPCAYSGAGLVP